MLLDHIREAFAYTEWANGRVLSAAAPLSAADFGRDFGVSFSSIHGTLAHMLGAEWVWLERCNGISPQARPESGKTVAELREQWAPVARGQRAFLETLAPEALDRPLEYTDLAGKPHVYILRQVLLHVPNHSTYHRGQIVSMLRQLGVAPPSTDFVRFVDDIAARVPA